MVKKVKKNLRLICFLFVFSACPGFLLANNLKIKDVALSQPDLEAQTRAVSFNLSWENSWRNSINHDAVWVFLKYTADGGQSWQHATLAASGLNPPGFSADSGVPVEAVVPEDKAGCFWRRVLPGGGSLELKNAKVIWDWGADGLEAGDSVQVKLFGIEMVYIPEGNFFLGDGDGNQRSAYAFHLNSNQPLAIEIGEGLVSGIRADHPEDDAQINNPGIGIGDGLDKNNDGIIDNPNFPTGYRGFYLMKYEISQGQYADFLNTLTASQAVNRFPGESGNYRQTIDYQNGAYFAARPQRAANFLSWPDLAAFAAWAGLRPLTESEYEKAARGPREPLLGEYAWGSDLIVEAEVISGPEDGSEKVENEGANCNFGGGVFEGGDGGQGPLRGGVFANADSRRLEAGASYFGVMELTGNVKEQVVSLGCFQGRAFEGSHGQGDLLENGGAKNSDWPGFVEGQGVTEALGSGLRGGSWACQNNFSLSAREIEPALNSGRQNNIGGRCARTAP